jgi:hypothetical protein
MSIEFWELKGMAIDIQFAHVRKIIFKSCICFPSMDTTHSHISKELISKLFKSNSGRWNQNISQINFYANVCQNNRGKIKWTWKGK